MNPLGVTKRQLDLLVFLKTYISDHGYSPNYAEICAGIGIVSKGSAHKHILHLIERGFVVSLPHKSRSISLTEAGLAVAVRFSEKSVPRATSLEAA